MKRIPCCFAKAASVCTYSTGAGTNPPSPSSSSMMTAATARTLGAAVAVGIGNPVHLGRERAEPLLVRHHLGGERHREVGTAVESVLEAEHRLSPGEVACHLHRVLDRLGAAV